MLLQLDLRFAKQTARCILYILLYHKVGSIFKGEYAFYAKFRNGEDRKAACPQVIEGVHAA